MYEDYVGKEVCGCTVLELLPNERGEVMALVDTHCPKCGVHKVRMCNLVTKQKHACVHEARRVANLNEVTRARREDARDRLRERRKDMKRERAEACVGKDVGAFHVDCIETSPNFKPNPSRIYLHVTCLTCGSGQIVSAHRVESAKCRTCSHVSPMEGLTAKYPKLYDSLKCHWQKCYSPSCDGYSRYGGKGWHFDARWVRYEDGRPMLNTRVAIEDCLELGWDEDNPRMILEKDKLANELGERVIGRHTVRCVDRSENWLHHFND